MNVLLLHDYRVKKYRNMASVKEARFVQYNECQTALPII